MSLGLLMVGCGPVAVVVGTGSGIALIGDDDDDPAPAVPPGGSSDTTPPTTAASPPSGNFSSSTTVTLTSNEAGTTYYTTDGSTPTTTSAQYSGPISVSSTLTLRFFSRDQAGNSESIRVATYTITTSPPPSPGAPNAVLSTSATSGTPKTVFQFDASGSSDGLDPVSSLQVRWDFESDGTWDTGFSTTKTASHKYPTQGTKQVRVEVRNTAGLTSQSSRLVSIGAASADLNGDGIADLVVGASDNEGGGTGKAYVFFGGTGLADVNLSAGGQPSLVFSGESAGDWFGWSVAVGDVNGDGVADLIVGAPLNGAGGDDAGRAYVFFGGPGLAGKNLATSGVSADLTFTGKGLHDQFGRHFALGDLNGDGVEDLAIGAPHESVIAPTPGEAYVFYGGAGLASQNLSAGGTANVTYRGRQLQDTLGQALAIGDVNGDGSNDLAIGVPHDGAGGQEAGRVYVFFGPTLASIDLGAGGTADRRFTGAAPFDEFGFLAIEIADVGGDGVDDLIVGSYLNDAAGANSGRTYVFFGGAGIADVDLSAGQTASVTITGESAGDSLGNFVSVADLNGDGTNDLIIASVADVPAMDTGRVYVFYGGSGLSTTDLSAGGTADVTLTGAAGGDRFSYVGTADLNADGRQDVIVGAIWNDAGGANVGRVYVFHGATLADTNLSAGGVANATFTGDSTANRFGHSVTGP